MKPVLYFSYGMTKSGSTLAYELARAALVVSGFDQPRLSTRAVLDRRKINFVTHLTDDTIDALLSEARALGHMVAIKTHTRPDPGIVALLQEGTAIAHATYRDPRDMALSMVDHGARSRAKGRPGFTEFHRPEDTIDNIRHQSNSLLAWLSLPGVKPLFYSDLAFDMEHTTGAMMDHMGLTAPTRKVIRMATKKRSTQKNKAVPERHKAEMSPALSDEFREIFAPFYARLIDGKAALPAQPPILNAAEPLCHWPKTTETP